MSDVQEINDIAELAELRSVWQSLLAVTPGADFFRSLDWLEVYWRHYGDEQRLRVLVVSEDGLPVGIVPLVVRRERFKVGSLRVLTYPMNDWGSFYGPIGPDPHLILKAALGYLKSCRRDWDLFELRWMDIAEDEHDWIAETMHELRFAAQKRIHTQIPIIEINETWDEYWSSRKSNWRNNCRRNEKKMQKLGELRHVRYRPQGSQAGEDDPRWDLYDECEQIAMASWQGTKGSGTTMSDDSIRAFLRDMHSVAVKSGSVDVNLLMVNDQKAAFSYNYFYQGCVSGLRLGFDPQFRDAGAGTILSWRMIRDSFERGDHTFDFLPGSLGVKRNWQTRVDTSYRYGHYPLTSGRAQLLRLKHWLFDRPTEPAISS